MTSSTITAAAPDAAEVPRDLTLRTVHQSSGSLRAVRLIVQGGSGILREVEYCGDAVAVLPADPERREARRVRRIRAPALVPVGSASVLAAPAGRMEGPDPSACAAREAFEECGMVLGRLEVVATARAMPAASTERIHLFLAPVRAADRTSPGGSVAQEGEEVEVETLPLAEFARGTDAGTRPDMKTMPLRHALRHRSPDLSTA